MSRGRSVIGDNRLGTLSVDDGRGRRQAVSEDPVALLLQSLVENARVGWPETDGVSETAVYVNESTFLCGSGKDRC